ncbi:MAG: hypothetical protein ABSD82_09515 [Solirubrobacteraceae bacterium]|jgi:hypothetical protein
MAHDASQILGSPQLAGVKVNPRGMATKGAAPFVGMYAGVVGAAISATAVGRANKQRADFEQESETPRFGRLAYLAVTKDEIALVELKLKGQVGLELKDVIVRVSRSEFESAELGGAVNIFSPPLTINFKGGEFWQLEVPRPSRKQAQAVVDVLASQL